MPNGVKLTLNKDGVRRILLGPALSAALDQIAERIADQARGEGIMVEHVPGDIPIPIRVRIEKGARVAASVILDHPSGIAVEAKHRLLGRSLDAGRI